MREASTVELRYRECMATGTRWRGGGGGRSPKGRPERVCPCMLQLLGALVANQVSSRMNMNVEVCVCAASARLRARGLSPAVRHAWVSRGNAGPGQAWQRWQTPAPRKLTSLWCCASALRRCRPGCLPEGRTQTCFRSESRRVLPRLRWFPDEKMQESCRSLPGSVPCPWPLGPAPGCCEEWNDQSCTTARVASCQGIKLLTCRVRTATTSTSSILLSAGPTCCSCFASSRWLCACISSTQVRKRLNNASTGRPSRASARQQRT